MKIAEAKKIAAEYGIILVWQKPYGNVRGEWLMGVADGSPPQIDDRNLTAICFFDRTAMYNLRTSTFRAICEDMSRRNLLIKLGHTEAFFPF